MSEITGKKMDAKTRLGTTNFNTDSEEHAHITIDKKLCAKCSHHMCMYGCPAECYTLGEDGVMQFQYEDCVECGTCDLMCDRDSVKWNLPRGGFGVVYLYG